MTGENKKMKQRNSTMGRVKKRVVERGVFSGIRLFLSVSQALRFSLMVMDGLPLWNNGTHIDVQHSETYTRTHGAHIHSLQPSKPTWSHLISFLKMVHSKYNQRDKMRKWNNTFKINCLWTKVSMKSLAPIVPQWFCTMKNIPWLRLNSL